MPRPDYVHCKDCERHVDEAGPLSHERLCEECGQRRLAENIRGLATMTGHVRDRWAVGMILSAGGVLPERLQKAS